MKQPRVSRAINKNEAGSRAPTTTTTTNHDRKQPKHTKASTIVINIVNRIQVVHIQTLPAKEHSSLMLQNKKIITRPRVDLSYYREQEKNDWETTKHSPSQIAPFPRTPTAAPLLNFIKFKGLSAHHKNQITKITPENKLRENTTLMLSNSDDKRSNP